MSRDLPYPLDCVWSIEPMAARQFEQAVRSLDLAQMRMPAGFDSSAAVERRDGVAIIDVMGVLTKRPSIFQLMFNSGSTEAIREAVQDAAADVSIHTILLRIDSPGGSADGSAELADAIFNARAQKRIVAQIDGLGASLAYLIASQAETIYAGRIDRIGSIGTLLMLYDWSEFYTRQGIEAVPIATGPFKAAGAEGTEITPEQRAYFQSIIDQIQQEFSADVRRGRGFSAEKLAAVSDGRIWLAPEAKTLGLIDGIQTFDETLQQLTNNHPDSRKRSPPMSDTANQTTTPAPIQTLPPAVPPVQAIGPHPATLADLRQGCPGADNDFLVSQIEAAATLAQAQSAWMKIQSDRNAALQKQVDEAKQTAEAATKKPGVQALGTDGGSDEPGFDGDPIAAFNAAVKAKVQGGLSRQQAIRAVCVADRPLHEAYLQAANPNRPKVRSLIHERFELNR